MDIQELSEEYWAESNGSDTNSTIRKVWSVISGPEEGLKKVVRSQYLYKYLFINGDPEDEIAAKSVALLIGSETTSAWTSLADSYEQKFIQWVSRIKRLEVDEVTIRFYTACFRNLYSHAVRTAVSSLVSVAILRNLPVEQQNELKKDKSVRSQWRKFDKRLENMEEEERAAVLRDSKWIMEVLARPSCVDTEQLLACLLSQIPTRRYTHAVVSSFLRDSGSVLSYYQNFPIDDFNGEALSYDAAYARMATRVKQLQATAKAYPEFGDFAFKSVSSAAKSAPVLSWQDLERPDLKALGYSVSIAGAAVKLHDILDDIPVLPSEDVLSYVPAYKLPSSSLSVADLVIKTYRNLQDSWMLEARSHIESVIRRLHSEKKKRDVNGDLKFSRESKYAASITSRPAVSKIVHPTVGTVHPALVQVEFKIQAPANFSATPGGIISLIKMNDGEIKYIRSGIIDEIDLKRGHMKINIDPSRFPAHEKKDIIDLSIVESMDIAISFRHSMPDFPSLRSLLLRSENVRLSDWLTDALVGLRIADDEVTETDGHWRDAIDTTVRKELHLSSEQSSLLSDILRRRLTVVDAPAFTGKTEIAVAAASVLAKNSGKVLLIYDGDLSDVRDKLCLDDLDVFIADNETTSLGVAQKLRHDLLQEVGQLAKEQGFAGEHGDSCETADVFFKNFLQSNSTEHESMHSQINFLRALEILPDSSANSLLYQRAKVVLMGSTTKIPPFDFEFDTVIQVGASIPWHVALAPLISPRLKRFVVLGDRSEYDGLFNQLARLTNRSPLNKAYGVRESINSLVQPSARDLWALAKSVDEYPANSGFSYASQFIAVPGETVELQPGVYQNRVQAAYTVALYKYMILLNYDRTTITIVATNIGQKLAMIKMLKKCEDEFGMPKVALIDDWRVGHCDYVLASLMDEYKVRDIVTRARKGLYFISDKGENLSVVLGELAGQTTRAEEDIGGDRAVQMEGLEHFEQYVAQMTEQWRAHRAK